MLLFFFYLSPYMLTFLLPYLLPSLYSNMFLWNIYEVHSISLCVKNMTTKRFI